MSPKDHCLPPHQLCMTVMMSAGSLMAAPLTTEDRTPGLSGHRAARHPPSPQPTLGPPGPQAQALEDSPALLVARLPPSARSSRCPGHVGPVTPLHLPEPGPLVGFRRMASPCVHAQISGPAEDSGLQPRCITFALSPFTPTVPPVSVLTCRVRHHLQSIFPSRHDR